VIIPIRDFTGMSRLHLVLDARQRAGLVRELATVAVAAARNAHLRVVVVSAAPEIARWSATVGAESWTDPGGGLSACSRAATDRLDGSPWLVLHADLPLVDARALNTVAEASVSGTVLVPSHDGGTNVIASSGGFPFAYGPGSFHRHFAAVPDATIISSPELSIDIDTPLQLSSFPELLNASTLSP
jgi:2-phospho-L-lactate guanylyltransferase